MLKAIFRFLLFRTLFKRFWWVPVVFVGLSKLLPWERNRQAGRAR